MTPLLRVSVASIMQEEREKKKSKRKRERKERERERERGEECLVTNLSCVTRVETRI